MHKKLLSILVLSVLVAAVLVGCGSSPAALTVASTSGGNVSVMKEGTTIWTEGQAGMSLEPGDIIKSGADSSAEITFLDGSTIELQAGTEVEVVTLSISTGSGSATIGLKQTIGSIIFRVTRIVDPASRYEVETPAGVVAIRGSAVEITVTEDGTTQACNLEGNIWAIARGVELQIPEGECCVIRPDQPPKLTTSLTISTSTGGSVTIPGEGTFRYDQGTVVDLWVEVNECYFFAGWSGDVITISNVNDLWTTITMSDSYSITANFELNPWGSVANIELHELQTSIAACMADAGTAQLTTWGDWQGESDVITVVVGEVTYDARDYIYGEFRATYTVQQDGSITNGYCDYPGGWGGCVIWDPINNEWVPTSQQ